MDPNNIFILAALMLKKLGGPLELDLAEFEQMAADPSAFVIDGRVEGDKVRVEFREVEGDGIVVGRETVN